MQGQLDLNLASIDPTKNVERVNIEQSGVVEPGITHQTELSSSASDFYDPNTSVAAMSRQRL
jgi:hypothetical protein